MSETTDYQRNAAADGVFHTWINQRQEERRNAGQPWESDLYEWMHAVQEMRRLPAWLRRARTNALPTMHQQCSHSAPETLANNRLVCAFGQEVTTCPILTSLYATFAEKLAQEQRWTQERSDWQVRLHEADADVLAARVCCWHIFTEQMRGKQIDTSEGYMQDESDRRFWSNLYTSLAVADGDDYGN